MVDCLPYGDKELETSLHVHEVIMKYIITRRPVEFTNWTVAKTASLKAADEVKKTECENEIKHKTEQLKFADKNVGHTIEKKIKNW